jgi:hypothetical protein
MTVLVKSLVVSLSLVASGAVVHAEEPATYESILSAIIAQNSLRTAEIKAQSSESTANLFASPPSFQTIFNNIESANLSNLPDVDTVYDNILGGLDSTIPDFDGIFDDIYAQSLANVPDPDTMFDDIMAKAFAQFPGF